MWCSLNNHPRGIEKKTVAARRCSNIQRYLVLTSCKVIGRSNIDYFEQVEDMMKYLFQNGIPL